MFWLKGIPRGGVCDSNSHRTVFLAVFLVNSGFDSLCLLNTENGRSVSNAKLQLIAPHSGISLIIIYQYRFLLLFCLFM